MQTPARAVHLLGQQYVVGGERIGAPEPGEDGHSEGLAPRLDRHRHAGVQAVLGDAGAAYLVQESHSAGGGVVGGDDGAREAVREAACGEWTG